MAIVVDHVLAVSILLRHAIAASPIRVPPGIVAPTRAGLAAWGWPCVIAFRPSTLRRMTWRATTGARWALALWTWTARALPVSATGTTLRRAALSESKGGGGRQTGGEAKR